MANETYHVYYGYRSSYVKSAFGNAIAVSKLVDPILPWKKSYIEIVFSLCEKYIIDLPIFSGNGNVSMNGSHLFSLAGNTDGKFFNYSTTFENQLLHFKEIQANKKYELYINKDQVGYIYYYPFLAKDLLDLNIGTVIYAPGSIYKIAILFALWRQYNYESTPG